MEKLRNLLRKFFYILVGLIIIAFGHMGPRAQKV
jgi:hypothetical protein